MKEFQIMNKKDFEALKPILFHILADNMTIIAPTGNSYEEDYQTWSECLTDNLNNNNRQIVLFQYNGMLIGFFMFSVSGTVLHMEEIQIMSEYQGGFDIFRSLFNYLFTILPENIETVDAYVNKLNYKSQSILLHLGLKKKNENKNNFYFNGNYSDLMDWFHRKKLVQ